jgi:biotin transporter BioY
MGSMEIIIGWLIWSGLVGWIASTRGRNPVAWFTLSVLLSPLLGLIAVLVVGKATPDVAVHPASAADEIAKLAALRDAGTITSEEFERQKTALLVRA